MDITLIISKILPTKKQITNFTSSKYPVLRYKYVYFCKKKKILVKYCSVTNSDRQITMK